MICANGSFRWRNSSRTSNTTAGRSSVGAVEVGVVSDASEVDGSCQMTMRKPPSGWAAVSCWYPRAASWGYRNMGSRSLIATRVSLSARLPSASRTRIIGWGGSRPRLSSTIGDCACSGVLMLSFLPGRIVHSCGLRACPRNADHPPLRTGLLRRPRKLIRLLCLQLVVQRLRVMVVDQPQVLAARQFRQLGEDSCMPISRRQRAYIEIKHRVVAHETYLSLWGETPPPGLPRISRWTRPMGWTQPRSAIDPTAQLPGAGSSRHCRGPESSRPGAC